MQTKSRFTVRYIDAVYAMLSITVFIVAYGFQLGQLMCALQVFALLKMWFECRKSQALLVINFFISLYSIPAVLHYIGEVGISAYSYYNGDNYYFATLTVHTLFLLIISCGHFAPKKTTDLLVIKKDELCRYASSWKYYAMLMCAVICMAIGKTGQTIFERQGYGQKGSSSSAIYEYFCFFYLLAFVFSGESKWQKKLLHMVAVLYVLKSLLYGNRVEVIQILLLIFILQYQNKLSTRNLLLGLAGGYFLMTLVGNFRSDLQLNIDSVGHLLGFDVQSNRLVNNESDVWYSSTVILNSLGTEAITLQYRIIATFNFLVRLIVPSSLLNQTYNVVPYLQKNLTAFGGGGLIDAFLYFYFGIFGLILGAIIIGTLFQKAAKGNQNIYWKIFLIQYLVMVPRWFAYSPEAIFKTPIYAITIFSVLTKIKER